MPRPMPKQRGDRDLHNGAGDRRWVRTDSRSFEGEMQADAEHQKDDADLREFIGDVLIRDDTPA